MKLDSTDTPRRGSSGRLGKGPPASEPSAAPEGRYDVPANEHVLQLLPEGARRVLDVGCAGGSLARALRARRPGTIVHGLERDELTAARAREHLDRLWIVDLGQPLPALEGPYDAIVCADVLEHLVDPWTALRGLAGQLAPDGAIVASLPNVRHYRVLRDLVLRGRFTYRETGVLDATHLRFFTLTEMERLFASAGLRVTARKPRLHGGNSLIKLLGWFRPRDAEELRTIQYTLVARRAEPGA